MELKRSTKRLMKRSQGKGDRVRPYDHNKFDENYDKLYPKKPWWEIRDEKLKNGKPRK